MDHTESTFKGHGGLRIYYQSWLSAAKPRAVLLVSHGLAEHSGRHERLARYFADRGYAVYCLDHRGHGRSEGRRCYVDRFEEYVADFAAFAGIVRRAHPDLKVFIRAQSMGGTIAVAYTLDHQDEVAGLVLTGAALKPGESISRAIIAIGGLLSQLLPRTGTVLLDAEGLSRDPAVVEAYVKDPLVYRGRLPARAGYQLIQAMRGIDTRMPELQVPLLIIHGTADRLTNPAGSRMLYEKASSAIKTLRLCEGLYHEVLNEPEGDRILAEMEEWVSRLAGPRQTSHEPSNHLESR